MLANADALCSTNDLAPFIISVNPAVPCERKLPACSPRLSNKLVLAKSKFSNEKSENTERSICPVKPFGKSPIAPLTASPQTANASSTTLPIVSCSPPKTSPMELILKSLRLPIRSVLIPSSPKEPILNPPKSTPPTAPSASPKPPPKALPRSKPPSPGAKPAPPAIPAVATLATTLKTLQDIVNIYGNFLSYPPTITSQLPIFTEQKQAAKSPALAIGFPSTVTEQLPFTIGCGNL